MLSQLLRFSLFHGENPISSPLGTDEWQRLFDESRRQAVTALLYDAILKLPPELQPPRSVLFHFTTITLNIEQDNIKREKALHDFATLVVEKLNGCEQPKLVVVKGSAQADYFPCPQHRECGDNDLYTGACTANIAKIIEGLGIEVDYKDPRHVSFVFSGVNFECHNYLLYHDDDPEWQTVPFRNESHDDGLYKLTPPHSAFFLAKHTEHHAVFFHQPVRLRDLVDWTLLVSSDGFDHDALDRMKHETDIEVFTELMSAYCNSLFGLALPAKLPDGLVADDFERIYMQCPPRHRSAMVRVVRRSWKYIRFGRKYKTIYKQSMFRRFYFKNVKTALKNKIQ